MALFRQDSLRSKPCTCGCVLALFVLFALGFGATTHLFTGPARALWGFITGHRAQPTASAAPVPGTASAGRFDQAAVEARFTDYYGATWLTPHRHEVLAGLREAQVGVEFTRKDFPSLTFAIPHTCPNPEALAYRCAEFFDPSFNAPLAQVDNQGDRVSFKWTPAALSGLAHAPDYQGLVPHHITVLNPEQPAQTVLVFPRDNAVPDAIDRAYAVEKLLHPNFAPPIVLQNLSDTDALYGPAPGVLHEKEHEPEGGDGGKGQWI